MTATSFVISLTLANRIYARFGVVGAALVLPVAYILGFSIWIATFTFVTAVAFAYVQQSLQREPEYIIHAVNRVDSQGVLDLRRHFDQVLGVLLRYDDRCNSRSVSSEKLLFHSSDRQHSSAKRDLPCHRHLASNRNLSQDRYDRGRNRYSC